MMIHRSSSVVRSSSSTRTIDVIASTDAIDSYGEKIVQRWRLERYRANPVVLWNHNASGGLFGGDAADTLPIGRAEDIRVEDKALRCRIVFVSADANPMAEKVAKLYAEGALNSVSVGFSPGDVRVEKSGNGSEVVVLDDNELFEISCVAIPANPEAVVEQRRKSIASLRSQVRTGPVGIDLSESAVDAKLAEVFGRTGKPISRSDAMTLIVAQPQIDAREAAAIAAFAESRRKAVAAQKEERARELAFDTRVADFMRTNPNVAKSTAMYEVARGGGK